MLDAFRTGKKLREGWSCVDLSPISKKTLKHLPMVIPHCAPAAWFIQACESNALASRRRLCCTSLFISE
jgi:hypothetical protein